MSSTGVTRHLWWTIQAWAYLHIAYYPGKILIRPSAHSRWRFSRNLILEIHVRFLSRLPFKDTFLNVPCLRKYSRISPPQIKYRSVPGRYNFSHGPKTWYTIPIRCISREIYQSAPKYCSDRYLSLSEQNGAKVSKEHLAGVEIFFLVTGKHL